MSISHTTPEAGNSKLFVFKTLSSKPQRSPTFWGPSDLRRRPRSSAARCRQRTSQQKKKKKNPEKKPWWKKADVCVQFLRGCWVCRPAPSIPRGPAEPPCKEEARAVLGPHGASFLGTGWSFGLCDAKSASSVTEGEGSNGTHHLRIGEGSLCNCICKRKREGWPLPCFLLAPPPRRPQR